MRIGRKTGEKSGASGSFFPLPQCDHRGGLLLRKSKKILLSRTLLDVGAPVVVTCRCSTVAAE